LNFAIFNCSFLPLTPSFQTVSSFPMTAVIQFKSAFRVFRGPVLPICVPSRICGETRSAFPLRPVRPITAYYGLLRPITAKEMRNAPSDLGPSPTCWDLLGPIGSYWDQKNVKTRSTRLAYDQL